MKILLILALILLGCVAQNPITPSISTNPTLTPTPTIIPLPDIKGEFIHDYAGGVTDQFGHYSVEANLRDILTINVNVSNIGRVKAGESKTWISGDLATPTSSITPGGVEITHESGPVIFTTPPLEPDEYIIHSFKYQCIARGPHSLFLTANNADAVEEKYDPDNNQDTLRIICK
ncbi:hypothetical protein HUU53_04245 [Candidatus Micrarchaeota archaeon]|nr:hypothetical protein [Candidatus Micrarchaeota archaeon]